ADHVAALEPRNDRALDRIDPDDEQASALDLLAGAFDPRPLAVHSLDRQHLPAEARKGIAIDCLHGHAIGTVDAGGVYADLSTERMRPSGFQDRVELGPGRIVVPHAP